MDPIEYESYLDIEKEIEDYNQHDILEKEKVVKMKVKPEYEEDSGNDGKARRKKQDFAEIKLDKAEIRKNVKLTILGIEVYFPYQPYPNQIAYMQKGKQYFILVIE